MWKEAVVAYSGIFFWRGEDRKPSVKAAGVRAKIRTVWSPNTRAQRHHWQRATYTAPAVLCVPDGWLTYCERAIAAVSIPC
jgi:hypothetical protein